MLVSPPRPPPSRPSGRWHYPESPSYPASGGFFFNPELSSQGCRIPWSLALHTGPQRFLDFAPAPVIAILFEGSPAQRRQCRQRLHAPRQTSDVRRRLVQHGGNRGESVRH